MSCNRTRANCLFLTPLSWTEAARARFAVPVVSKVSVPLDTSTSA